MKQTNREVIDMNIKCALCEKTVELKDDAYQAKRLRNKFLKTYMCADCDQRIRQKVSNRPEKNG